MPAILYNKMGNHCAPCCFQKSGDGDSILQADIKDPRSGYKLDNSIRGKQASSNALPSSKMDLSSKQKTAGLVNDDYGLGDETSLPYDTKYLKVTLDQAFAESAEDIFLGLIDNEQCLDFTVCVNNFKFQNLSLKEEVSLTCHIGEDYIEREHDQQTVQNDYATNINQTTDQSLMNTNVGLKQPNKIPRSEEEMADNHTRWESKRVVADQEGTAYIDEENHFKYHASYGDLQRSFFVLEVFCGSSKRPISIIMIDIMALAIGPKHCDFEVKDLRLQRSYGRVQFDVNIQQIETMEVTLQDLMVRLNGKEERPLISQFKVITNKELPKVSDTSKGQIGRFKKEKNQTKFSWDFLGGEGSAGKNAREESKDLDIMKFHEEQQEASEEDEFHNMTVQQEISLEALKNSTIQLLLRVDTFHAEYVTEKIMSKMRKQRNFTMVTGKKNATTTDDNSNKQGVQKFVEIPSNGQGEVKHKKGVDADNGSGDEEEEETKNVPQKSKRNHAVAGSMPNNNSFLHPRHDAEPSSLLDTSHLMGVHKEGLKERRISFEIHEHPGARSRSMAQKEANRNSHNSSFVQDGKGYYQNYEEEKSLRDSVAMLMNDDLVGECYVGFSKLMQSELRKQERRNSNILQNRLSQTNRLSQLKGNRLSSMYTGGSSNRDINKTSLRPVSVFGTAAGKNNGDSSLKGFGLSGEHSPQGHVAQGEKKVFEEQIWIMGKLLGTVRGTFYLGNLPVMQQMTLGVLTENGISMNVSPIDATASGLSGLMKKGTKNNEKITQMIDLISKLKKLDQVSGTGQKGQQSQTQQKKNEYNKYNEKLTILNSIIDLLIEDDRAMDGHMFKYVDELDLMRAQYAMIDLAFHCLTFVESVRYELKKEYYEILSQIFMRDELRLTNLALGQIMDEIEEKISVLKQQSFDENPMMELSMKGAKGKPAQQNDELAYLEKVKEEKGKIAVLYQKLLHQTLDDCLTKFTRKDVEHYLRSYLEICISVAFFRVPRFQKIFLNCIKSAEDPDPEKNEITEWRNIDWEIDEEQDDDMMSRRGSIAGSDNRSHMGLFKLFDWEYQFFQHLPKQGAGVHQKDLDDAVRYIRHIESNKKWQARVKKRSIAYFQIIKRWAELLKNTVKTYSLLWQDIPGYRYIVKSLLLELKTRKPADYPDSLIDATTAIIENPQLLSVVTNIVFLKTNAFDSVSLCTTMSLLTKWFTHLEKIGLAFPSNFDLSFFISGINVALEMDHSVSTPRTLHLLFKILHYFPLDQRAIIVQELFSAKFFYQLFFSWSYNIRDVFIALFLYQVEYFFVIRTTDTLNMAGPSDGNDLVAAIGITQNAALQGGSQSVRKPQEPPNSLLTVNPSSGEKTKQQIARGNRKESLGKLEGAIKNIEMNLQANPGQAETDFDRSISMKKVRQTQDISGNSGNMSIRMARVSVNQQNGLMFKRAGFPPAPTLIKQDSKPSGMGDKRRLVAGGPAGKAAGPNGTVSQFVKTYKLYKKIQTEIDILEEYLAAKMNLVDLTAKPSNNSKGMAINESNGSSYKGPKGPIGDGDSTYDLATLEREAKKVLAKIPSNLHIYIHHAIHDFYKQVEEYEHWKTNTANFYLNGPQGDQIVVSHILPEFNMEKNMPVEDDENLAKQEDW